MRSLIIALLALLPAGAQVPDQAFFLGAPATIAQTCAEKASTLKPLHIEVLVTRGRTHLAIGDRKQAEEWFARAERVEPKDAETYQVIAQAWLASGFREEVRAMAVRAREMAPRDSGDLMDFAVILMDSGFADEARSLADQALKVDPKDASMLVDYGSACLRAKRTQEGAQLLERAIALNPMKLGIHRDVAEAYADHTSRSDLPEIKARMLHAAEVGFSSKESDHDKLATLARIHLVAGNRTQAEAIFKRIMTSKDVYADTFQLIGQAWLRAGFTEEAFRAYQVLPSARGEGGVVGFGNYNSGTPNALWAPVVTIDLSRVNRKRALTEAAIDLARAGHFDRALPLMEEVYLTDSRDQNDLVKFGRMALERGHREDAARFFQKAIQADPKDWEVWCSTAQAHLDFMIQQSPSAQAKLSVP